MLISGDFRRFVIPLRNVSGAFQSYIRGLFKVSRGSLLHGSEAIDTDSQALHYLLTEAGVDWGGSSGGANMTWRWS